MLKGVTKQYLTNLNKNIVIFIGVIAWSLTMVKSGWLYSYGYGFWGANGYDGIWHISLINNLSKFNFQNPVFSGERIKNYHIGFDLLIGILNRATHIPVNYLYFQILPLIFSLLIGLLTYKFVFDWTQSKKGALLATIFTYFGGSMAWILGRGESTFWSQQAISTLINPSYALSLIFILLGLIYARKKNYLSILFFSLLIFVKVYAGLLILGGLFFASIYSYFKNRSLYYTKVFITTFIFSILLYLPFNSLGLGLIKWEPFWFLESMFAAGDRFIWPKMAEAMLSYKNQSVIIKFVLAYGFALLLFTLGNFWTRLIFLRDALKKMDAIKIIMLFSIIAGFMIPLFFVQSGTPWNTIQFIYYSLFFSGILTGITLNKVNNYLCLFIVLITIPTTFISLKGIYVTNTPPAIISKDEIVALNFLKNQPEDGVVLTYPYDLAYSPIPLPNRIPLYKYATTSYVSAYTSKNEFFERTNLEIMDYDWENRRDSVKLFFNTLDVKRARNFLKSNNIKYLYLVKEMTPLPGELFKLGPHELGLVKIFENKVSIIYRYGENIGSN